MSKLLHLEVGYFWYFSCALFIPRARFPVTSTAGEVVLRYEDEDARERVLWSD